MPWLSTCYNQMAKNAMSQQNLKTNSPTFSFSVKLAHAFVHIGLVFGMQTKTSTDAKLLAIYFLNRF